MKTFCFTILLIFVVPCHGLAQTDSLAIPLIHAVKTCSYTTVLNALKSNVAIDEVDVTGKTPLHHAVLCGNPDIVSLLLLHKADPFIEDEDGIQPLGYAKLFHQSVIIDLLLDHLGNQEVQLMR